MQKYLFQYCQKIVVFSKDQKSVLLCKRKDEPDYNGIFSFIGGKMEITDKSILDGVTREKNEEVGTEFKIEIFPAFTTNVFFTKKDGNSMILPHFYAIHKEGEIHLNEEYSEYKWVPLSEVNNFEPKINTIPDILEKMEILKKIIHETSSVVI